MRLSRAIAIGIVVSVSGGIAVAQQSGVPGTTQTQDGVYSNSVHYARGQSLQPVFEGWEKNADGTFSMWFGYLNRNDEERRSAGHRSQPPCGCRDSPRSCPDRPPTPATAIRRLSVSRRSR